MNSWKFYNPTEIIFGTNLDELFETHLENASTLFLTTPGWTKRGMTKKVLNVFKEKNIEFKYLDIATPNPSFIDLNNISNSLIGFYPKQIISLGGGSVLDLGKILSYFLSENAPTFEVLINLLKNNKPLPIVKPINFVAIPTTAGTGSEVTPFATIWDTENKKKYSISGNNLFPKKAVLIPELSLSLPWEITLSTGLDALSQCLESVWNKNFTPLTGSFAARGMKLILHALPKLKNDSLDIQARRDLMEGSLLSGLCISQTRTAMAHSISYPLTAHYGTPHGIACSFTLPDLWDFNFKNDDGRMEALISNLGISSHDFSTYLLDFLSDLKFKDELKKTILSKNSVIKLSEEMFSPGRSDNNLRNFNPELLNNFLHQAISRWFKDE